MVFCLSCDCYLVFVFLKVTSLIQVYNRKVKLKRRF